MDRPNITMATLRNVAGDIRENMGRDQLLSLQSQLAYATGRTNERLSFTERLAQGRQESGVVQAIGENVRVGVRPEVKPVGRSR